MNSKSLIIGTATALAAAFAFAPAAPAAVNPAANPFSATTLAAGYQLADNGAMPGKETAEAKCGAAKAKQAQEARCGADKAQPAPKVLNEAKCGEAKCGANKRRL